MPLGLDEADLEALYERLEKSLYNVAYRWLWSRDEARDVVQETFLRLWKMRARIEPETVNALAHRIALNLAVSRCRTRKLWRWIGLESLRERSSGGRAADEELAAAERADQVRGALESLPQELRRVLVLCESTDMTQVEIGESLGLPAGTVASRRHRALQLLRESLESLRPEK